MELLQDIRLHKNRILCSYLHLLRICHLQLIYILQGILIRMHHSLYKHHLLCKPYYFLLN